MLRKFASGKLASVIQTEDEFNTIINPSYGSLTTTSSEHRVRKVVKYNPDFVYARFKAIGSVEVDGPNANADAFPYIEFLDNRPNYGYQSFIGKHAFIEHSSDNINNSIGDLHHAYLNRFDTSKFGNTEWQFLKDDDRAFVLANRNPEDDGSIEVLMAVDRKLSPTVARMLETGSPTGCSMGTNIDYSECSVCGNRAYVEENYCPHIKFSKGQYVLVPAQQISNLVKSGSLKPEWLPWILQRSSDIKAVKTASRKMVYAKAFELNYGLSFFELSVVANPAYSRGYKLEKIASLSASAQLLPLIRVAGKPIEAIFKISNGYYNNVLNTQDIPNTLAQRNGEIAKTALFSGNVHEVLVDQRNAPYFIKDKIELTAAETPGFYKVSNPGVLLEKQFANIRHRDKVGVVGTISETLYACASCMNVFERNTNRKVNQDISKFDTFSICPECPQQIGIQHIGDNTNMSKKRAEYETLPTTTEFTGDKEVIPGKGAFVEEKSQLYEPWAEKGSKLIEKEKEYRPMGTIFIDPIVAKSDLNSRATRITELSKSARILISRIKLSMEDPAAFMSEMKKSEPIGVGMGIGPKPPMDVGMETDLGIEDPMGGMMLEIDMTPDSAAEILNNAKQDLEMVANDLMKAKQLVDTREVEASKAIEKKIRWSRRFALSAVKTAESVDMIIEDAEAAVSDALLKLQKACDMLFEASEIDESSMDSDKDDFSSNPADSDHDADDMKKDKKDDKNSGDKEDSKSSNPFEFKSKNKSDKSDKDKSDKDKSDKPSKGDDAMAKESTLELTEGNINLLQKLRVAFAGSPSLPSKTAMEDDSEKKDDSMNGKDEKDEKDEKDDKDMKKKKFPFEKKEAAAQPPTGARDLGDYADPGRIESYEMKRWWQDMYPEFEKMKGAEVAGELNEPDSKVELLTGFLGNKSADDPEVGHQTSSPDIFNVSPKAAFVKRFTKAGPKWAQSFIGVVKLGEDGQTEAFTANFRDIAGETGGEAEFEQFNSEEYLDRVIATVKDYGMNAAFSQMRGKVAQLEGITPGKTEKVNPLYDTKEENKHSNTSRPGERPDKKDGHGTTAGDKEFYGKAYGDAGFASDLTTANKKIAALSDKITTMETKARSDKMAEYALHLARMASSRGICPFDIPNIQKQAMEYIQLDEPAIQAVKAHIEKLPVVNQRALEAYQIPEAENMQNGVIHNNVDAVDTVRNPGGTYPQQPDNVAPEGIQPAVKRDAEVSANLNEDRIRKQAAELTNNIVPQMHASANTPQQFGGMPDVTKYFKSTIENQLKRAGAYEANKQYLRSNRI